MREHYQYAMPVEELCQRYSKLYSGVLYDIMDRMGLPRQALASDIKPLNRDWIVAAPAFTVKGIPDTSANKNLRSRRVNLFKDMKDLGMPVIDVRDCSFDIQVAHYGEMNAVMDRYGGAAGAVIDGGCRDSRFILNMNHPTFCRYQSPIEAYQRWSYYEWQVPVGLRGALSSVVPVRPGDFIFGDLDGVVVVPKEQCVEILLKAERLVEEETAARGELLAGHDPVEVYRKYGKM